jgi:ankyrin repeat protein
MFGKSGVSLGGKSPSDAAGKAQDLMGQPTFAHDDYLSLLLVKCGEDLSEIKNDVMHSAELLAKQSKVAERAAHVVMRSFSTAVKVYRERVERENEEKERIKRVIYAEAVKPWQNVALDCAAPLSPQQKQTGQERVGAVSGAGAGAGAGGHHLSPPATPPSNARVLGTLSPVSVEHTPKATSLSSPLKEKLEGAGGRRPSSIVLTCSEGKVQALQELLLMRRGSYHGQVSHEVATVHRITNSPTASKMNGSLRNVIRRNSLHDLGEGKTMENLNVADASGKTPLQMALDHQSWGCLRVLLKEDDVDVEMQDAYGNTPIHTYMSSRGAQRAPDILDLFIETRQVDLGIRNAKGQTPLMCCAGNRFIDAVGEEAEGKFDRVPTGEREDRNSSTSGGPASPSPVSGSKSGPGGPSGGVVPGGKPKPAKPAPSVPATPSGMSMLSRLIKMGADVCDEDDDGKTAIDYAAASACINELKMLATNPECEPNHLTSALFSTMGEGAECDIHVIKYLLDEAGADPVEGHGKMDNVLIAACRMNRVSCLEYLLKIPSIKKLIFERNALGLTALHEAVAKKSNDCAKILLDIIREESTFGVVTRNRRSAPGLKHVVKRIAASPPDDPMLMILDDKLVVAAAESCNLEVLPLIVTLNPYLANCHFNYYDASAQERVETSLLCWSIKMCDTELVKKLVDECAIITDADPGSGLTPLMQAIECLSEGHFAKLALATLQRGVDHIYLELDQVAEVTCMTKPQVVQIADALRDGSGNSLRSKAGKQLYSRSPWMCSWEGLVAISCATDPDLGKILREYTAELEQRKNIYAQISKIFFAYHEDVNVVANGSTALAIAAHRCNWKVFEELVAVGADRQVLSKFLLPFLLSYAITCHQIRNML